MDVFEAREYIGSVSTGYLFIKYVPYENGGHGNLKEYILRKPNQTKQKQLCKHHFNRVHGVLTVLIWVILKSIHGRW